MAISRISIVSFSEESIEAENADGPPKYVDLVEALDKLRRRFSFTASLSNNFALKKKKGRIVDRESQVLLTHEMYTL